MEEVDITIIGAGVVGLAIAAELSKINNNMVVLERHSSFGQEISSRNSEVIHSGIYYPTGSLKARLCTEGRKYIYEICEQNRIPHRRTGKLVIAVKEDELSELERLSANGLANGVSDLRIIDRNEIRKIEPHINAEFAILSPSTGIIDSHKLMKYFETNAINNNVLITYGANLIGIHKNNGGYVLNIIDADNQPYSFSSRIVVNSAGLDAHKIAEMVGINLQETGYKIYLCKGEYFSLPYSKSKLVNGLVYPVPDPDLKHLGIHVTKDLGDRVKLGPSLEYVTEIDYNVNETNKRFFYSSAKQFLPFLEPEDLSPDMAGIRPKLQGPNDGFRDFVIEHEYQKGLDGFINLLGIESPGLTSAPAIARYVADIVRDILQNTKNHKIYK